MKDREISVKWVGGKQHSKKEIEKWRLRVKEEHELFKNSGDVFGWGWGTSQRWKGRGKEVLRSLRMLESMLVLIDSLSRCQALCWDVHKFILKTEKGKNIFMKDLATESYEITFSGAQRAYMGRTWT